MPRDEAAAMAPPPITGFWASFNRWRTKTASNFWVISRIFS